MKGTRTIRCHGYVRVSTLRQADLEHGSLDAQADEIRNYLKFRKNPQTSFDIEGILREEGRSAKDTDRPELQKLLDLIRQGKVDAVVVTKIDRLTRSVKDFYDLWGEFERHNVQLISVRDQFDTTTPMGKAMVNMILTFAQLEREMTAERVRNKMLWHAEQGLWNGGRPPGFRLDPKQKGVLLPHSEEQPLVQTIFKKYLDLGSAGELAKFLARQGIKTPVHISRRGRKVGGQPFYKTTLLKMLRNPVYIGKIRYAGKVHPGQHQAIISKELFDQVNEHLRVHAPLRKNPRARREHIYLLQGIVFCGKCGAHMTPKACSGTKQSNFYYQCTRNGHTNGAACSMRYVPAETLETSILGKLREIAIKSDDMERIVRDANEHSNDSLKELADNRRRVEGELQAATDKAERLVDVLKEQGAAGLKIVGDELKKLEAERGRLDKQLAEIKQEMRLVETETMNAEVMVTSLKTFADILGRATPEDLKSLLPMFVERIVFHDPDDKGQGRVQLSLFERPVRREDELVGAGINHSGSSSAQSSYWCAARDSNPRPAD